MLEARERIRGDLPTTPLWQALGLDAGGELYLKLENQMPTGSFKVRGAFSRLRALHAAARQRGVIAASTGNHGAAIAYAARQLGVAARVIVPETTPADRVAAIERFGVEVTPYGAECGEAEVRARSIAEENGLTFVSPYNDGLVMAGQGTMGLEIAESAPPSLVRVYVAVGGGGLAGGVATALRGMLPSVEIVGCSPDATFAMEAAVAAGEVVDVPHLPTLSLATAGALEAGTVTLEPCAREIDRWMRCDEGEIGSAMRAGYDAERVLMEGAAGVALACWRKDKDAGATGAACVIICGGNVDIQDIRRVFAE